MLFFKLTVFHLLIAKKVHVSHCKLLIYPLTVLQVMKPCIIKQSPKKYQLHCFHLQLVSKCVQTVGVLFVPFCDKALVRLLTKASCCRLLSMACFMLLQTWTRPPRRRSRICWWPTTRACLSPTPGAASPRSSEVPVPAPDTRNLTVKLSCMLFGKKKTKKNVFLFHCDDKSSSCHLILVQRTVK